jgi:23S rRNA (adenine2503-C2)-methyltransferase
MVAERRSQSDIPQTRPLPMTRMVREGGVTRFCQGTADGHEIESVVIPMGAQVEGQDKTWQTLCVSSQIGCRWACSFCATGRMGFVRDLSVAEIVGQIEAARTELGADIRNVVFMGMGEPLDNLDNVVAAIRLLHEDRRRREEGC